jgi:DNA-directed RNA polymerase specialized sigma24 family protein
VFVSVGRGILLSKLSSIDDSPGKDTLMADTRPWWMDDPELIALRERALADLELAVDESEPSSPDEPDPVIAEIYSGAVSRELSAVRDELAAVRGRYEDAVVAARIAGLSWTEIGRLLGVSRQQVHRQFRNRPTG